MRPYVLFPLLVSSLGCLPGAQPPPDAGCGSGWSATGPWTGACPGTASAQVGLLAGGGAGQAVAASRFGPLGARVILATTAAGACSFETGPQFTFSSANAAAIRMTLAPGLGPGSYALSPDAGSAIRASHEYSTPCGSGGGGEGTGEVTLTQVDPGVGVQGSYRLDFGRSPLAGGSGTLADGGIVTCGPIGELIEEGSFDAPPCELCPVVPTCGDAGCPSGQICQRGCGGPDGQCIPAPSCCGAPSCGDCAFDPATACLAGPGSGCYIFDGFSLVCGCFP
ncbi:MAG: hypothetical protein ACYCWW_16895 [Deltaproteobacteria bacterium]